MHIKAPGLRFALKPRQWAIGILFLIGCFSLSMALLWKSPSSQRDPEVAKLQRENDSVFWQSQLHEPPLRVAQGHGVAPGDTLSTNQMGLAELKFENGAQLQLQPETQVRLQREHRAVDGSGQDDWALVLILEHGEISVLRPGQDNLFISKNGQRVPVRDYNDSELKQLHFEAKSAQIDPPANGLSDQDINLVMSGRQSDFFKCYTHLLQKEPQARGEVVLNFLILVSGKTDEVEAVPQWRVSPKERAPQSDFLHCLKEVVTRVNFRPHPGPKVTAVFPLKFD